MPNIPFSKVLHCHATIAHKGANPHIVGDTPYCTFVIKNRQKPIVLKGQIAVLQYKAYMEYKERRGRA